MTTTVLFLMLLQHRISPYKGQIEGAIVSNSGRPVGSVVVFEARLDSGPDPHAAAETDKNGHFLVDNLPNGKYRIYAKSATLGIPDQSFLIFQTSDTRYPEVDVNQIKPSTVGVIVLPKPFGTLTLHVVDATKKPIPFSEVTLRPIDNPKVSFSTATNAKGELTLNLPYRRFDLEVRRRASIEGNSMAIKRLSIEPIDTKTSRDLYVTAN